MSLLKVNTIESLSGPTGIINIAGEIVVNGIPISGTAGPTGATGVAGATGSGGISGANLVYVSADSDPVTNGINLQNAYDEAKLLTQNGTSSFTWEYQFSGNLGIYLDYNSFLTTSLKQLYYHPIGSSGTSSTPVSCTIGGSPAWYTYDGMSFQMSSTFDMMTPIEAGTQSIVTEIITYTYTNLIIASGYYQLSETFIIDSERVNITSVSGEPDVFIYSPNPSTMMGGEYAWVWITANDITVTGISTALKLEDSVDGPQNGNGQIRLSTSLNKLVMKNCNGGAYSFGGGQYETVTISGTFINCKVFGNYGFGYNSDTLSGTFENCKSTGGDGYGFGYSSTLSGVFTNCSETGSAGFGSSGGILSGTFYNCTSGSYGFGSGGDIISGEFYNCITGIGSFSANTVSGLFYNCVGAEGTFGTLNSGAKLYHCVIKPGGGGGLFANVAGGSRTYYCIDGAGNVNNQ
jgi:hypothetical protein